MPPTNQQYTFNPLPTGKVQILENGKDISAQGTPGGFGFEPSYAASLGYKAPTQSSKEPTVISSDQTDKIKSIQDAVGEASKIGLQTVDGKQYYPDGTPYTDAEKEKARTDRDELSLDPSSPFYVLNPKSKYFNPNFFKDNPDKDPLVLKNNATLDSLKAQGDAFFAREIENIRAQYSSLIEEQRQANKSAEGARQQTLLMAGTSRYAPLSEVSVMHDQISYGLSKVEGLMAKQSAAILDAQKAMMEQDFKLAEKRMDQYETIRKERNDAVSKIYNRLQDTKEKIAEENRQIAEDRAKKINEVLISAGKSNAPASVLDAIANSKTLGEAVKAAGGYLQSSTNEMMSAYIEHRRQALAMGVQPMDILDFQAQWEKNQQKPTQADPTLSILREINIRLGLANLAKKTTASPGQFVSRATGYPVEADMTQVEKDMLRGSQQILSYYVPTLSGLLDGVVTGAIKGRANKYTATMPLAQYFRSEDLSRFNSLANYFSQQIVYMNSGKQINVEEMRRLEQSLPSSELTVSENLRRIKDFKDITDTSFQRYMANQGWTIKEGEPERVNVGEDRVTGEDYIKKEAEAQQMVKDLYKSNPKLRGEIESSIIEYQKSEGKEPSWSEVYEYYKNQI